MYSGAFFSLHSPDDDDGQACRIQLPTHLHCSDVIGSWIIHLCNADSIENDYICVQHNAT